MRFPISAPKTLSTSQAGGVRTNGEAGKQLPFLHLGFLSTLASRDFRSMCLTLLLLVLQSLVLLLAAAIAAATAAVATAAAVSS